MTQTDIKLKEIYDFLKERNKIYELCTRADATHKTVAGTFEQPNFNSLKGKQIDICTIAIQMIEEIKQLPLRASEAINS